MKKTIFCAVWICAIAITSSAGNLFYVATNSAVNGPGTSWTNAFHTIQGAVDAAAPGDVVLVTNGVYASGGRSIHGIMTNRVAIDKPITVTSVNGPEFTIIVGQTGIVAGAYSAGAIRGVYLTNNAVLSGFTVQGGYTLGSGTNQAHQMGGGGILGESDAATVSNCWILYNGALYGGGVYGATVVDSDIEGNAAVYGGGTIFSKLINARLMDNLATASGGGTYETVVSGGYITGNHAGFGGGIYGGAATNALVVFNTATNGGGISRGTISASIVYGNEAEKDGGGVHNATAYSCFIINNTANLGGGGLSATLNYCTVVNNHASDQGGGLHSSRAAGSIVYYNTAAFYPNYASCQFEYSCTWPHARGIGNIADAPRIAGPQQPFLLAGSPCIDAAITETWMTGAADAEGDARVSGDRPDIGADEFVAGSRFENVLTVEATSSWTVVARDFPVPLEGFVYDRASSIAWDFGDGTGTSGLWSVTHEFLSPGEFAVVFSASNAAHIAAATITVTVVEAPVFRVAPSGIDTNNGLSWASAFSNIQTAVDVAEIPGSVVLVSNGVYQSGGRIVDGTLLTNRLVIDKPIRVKSVNGPDVTVIAGHSSTNGGLGDDAVRGVYLASFAILDGFTISNGFTRSEGHALRDRAGGGVWAESDSARVTNCIISRNFAESGGGLYRATVYQSVLSENAATNQSNGGRGGAAMGAVMHHVNVVSNRAQYVGGGLWECVIYDAIIRDNTTPLSSGGGIYDGVAHRSIFLGNTAQSGGAAAGSYLNQSLVASNTAGSGAGLYDGTAASTLFAYNLATNTAGGAYNSKLYNCTVVGNTAQTWAGGLNFGTAVNTIVAGNQAPANAEYGVVTFSYSRAFPLPDGAGNITNDPVFVDAATANYSLASNSPCIHRGTNIHFLATATDIVGEPRQMFSRIDMGAYEYNGIWPDSDGDGLADWFEDGTGVYRDEELTGTNPLLADTDGDGQQDGHEVRAGADPNNQHDFFALSNLGLTPGLLTLNWRSATGKTYRIERSHSPMPSSPVDWVVTNIAATPPINQFSNAWTILPPSGIYKIIVE